MEDTSDIKEMIKDPFLNIVFSWMERYMLTQPAEEQRQYLDKFCTCDNCGAQNKDFIFAHVYISPYQSWGIDDIPAFSKPMNTCDDCYLVLTLLDRIS